MSKRFKLITALLALIFCMTAFGVTASAVEGDDSQSVVIDDGQSDESVQEPEQPAQPAVDDNPGQGGNTGGGSSDYNSQSDYNDYNDSYSDNINYDYNDYSNNYSNDNNYDYNYGGNDYSNQYEEYNDVNSYLGGDQTYVEPVTSASSASLYDVDENDIDDTELASSEWKSILANINTSSGSGDDSDDFGFIKNNTSKVDNGDWMLIVGISLMVLSAAGIAYVIISNVMTRKKVAVRAGGRGTAPMRQGNSYSDGYNRTDPRARQAQQKRRSKFDTADVVVPRSSDGSHYKNNSNGKRYK